MYYKITRTSNGGWLKEEIKQRVYPFQHRGIDCIAINDGCWEVKESNTFMGIVAGYHTKENRKKIVIEKAKSILDTKPEEMIKNVLLCIGEYRIKFNRMP